MGEARTSTCIPVAKCISDIIMIILCSERFTAYQNSCMFVHALHDVQYNCTYYVPVASSMYVADGVGHTEIRTTD